MENLYCVSASKSPIRELSQTEKYNPDHTGCPGSSYARSVTIEFSVDPLYIESTPTDDKFGFLAVSLPLSLQYSKADPIVAC